MSKRSLRDRSDDEDEIKRPVQLTDEQKRFVNIGYLKWSKIRQEWTGVNLDNKGRSRRHPPYHQQQQQQHSHSSASSPSSSSTSNSSSSAHQHSHTVPSAASASSSTSSRHPSVSPPPQPPPSTSDIEMSTPYDYDEEATNDPSEGAADDSDSDDDSGLNLQHVMECLKTYRAFERPIKLRTMIDIVTVLWEDEPT